MKRLYLILGILCTYFVVHAQETYPVNGVHDEREKVFAFTNANIFTSYNQKVENATLVIKDGKVAAVGASASIPKNAVVIDLNGKYIYPSFIEIFSDYGLSKEKDKKGSGNDGPQFISDKKGAYGWNEAIRPETAAHEIFTKDSKAAEELRALGFGATVSHVNDGIARGTGILVTLGGETDNEIIIKDKAAAFYSFSKGSSSQNYPSSLMGSIALLRQSYNDAEWYAANPNEEYNISLESFNKIQDLPQIFDAGNLYNIFRADKVGDEFGKQYIIKGNGKEYQRLEELKATTASLIIPLNFPDAYDVTDPFDAKNVTLNEMKHWELAPHNAGRLAKANIEFALTTHTLKDKKAFSKNLGKAIKNGLSHEDALKALTHTPAKLIGAKEVGSLERGKIANFIILSDSLFKEKTVLYDNWVQGNRFSLKAFNDQDLRGNYQLKVGNESYQLEVGGEATSPEMNIVINDSTKLKVNHKGHKEAISIHFYPDKEQEKGAIRLSGWITDKNWKGSGNDSDGNWVDWAATYESEYKKEEKKKEEDKDKKGDDKEEKKEKKKEDRLAKVTYPFGSYGWEEAPKSESVLLKNATVWTNEDDGILEEADVLIKNGKISQVGKGLSAGGGREIDCEGKHVTCGIIDEHSHIAISRGVNEGTQASSAEVRIGDVVKCEDINIYRQLAGGVTTAQLLHGSANPIGGQSAIIKFRWGSMPEKMKLEGADGFIKFALGENVKQSGWGDKNTVRFPQTRMGVEQVFLDHFNRAKAYKEAQSKGEKVRKDIELEALAEIIDKERFITCHSYVQSEITMLMRVAEVFGFNVNTFTHILEGYKIADKMKEHGVSASTFSDWWAYKYEVIDAIPHNGAILNEMGVITSFNSDDAEMGRRLNQEAAKAVKYGSVSEEDAWKFVTLNPAKMLHIDNKVGSLKAGKDGDVVVWSDHPLSIYAKAEYTFVDGICYYDKEKDAELRKAIAEERNRLIQKMIAAKNGGAKTQKPKEKHNHYYHCDDMGWDEHEEEN